MTITERTLRTSALLLIAGFVVHNGDHARRGIDATGEAVVWAGTLTMVLATVIVTLIMTRHSLAPAAATAGGAAIAIGVTAAHLVPDWGPLSDSLIGGEVDSFTWVAVLLEIVAAAWMAWVGLTLLKRNNFQFGDGLVQS